MNDYVLYKYLILFINSLDLFFVNATYCDILDNNR